MFEGLDQIPASYENIQKLEARANADFLFGAGLTLVFLIVGAAYIYAYVALLPISFGLAMTVLAIQLITSASVAYSFTSSAVFSRRALRMRQELECA